MKLFLIYALIAIAIDKPLQRLDPHGDTKELKFTSSCSVCHTEKKGKVTLKPGTQDSCLGCHNKSPHSGAPEHMGKVFKGKQINCLSCHEPHRTKPMVKKTCTECHKW
ncbi:MAG: cytochrome c3 family protein [Oligoflexia bacterium]|nr:cytochrome c3 family protein [Oligoflexia bacterium]